jgi:hypothetical protein
MLIGKPDETNWLIYVFTSPTMPTLGSKPGATAGAGVAAETVGDDEVVAADTALDCLAVPTGLVVEDGEENCGSVLACAEAAW